MASSETVRARISAIFSSLSRKQKQVARFVMDNEFLVSFASAADVAKKIGISTATVVRFCQTLGYEGYPDLQAAIRQSFPRSMTRIQRLEGRLASLMPEDNVPARVFANDIDNLKNTLELLDPTTLEAAVTEICQAAGILVVGEAVSAVPATFLEISLKAMGLPVRAVTSGGASLSLELALLRPSDLVVGIGFWRYSRETVEAMSWASEIGAKKIAITDSPVSPLAQLADHSFTVLTNGIAHSISPIAAISLINTLVAAISFQRPKQTLAALRKVDDARKEKLMEQ